MNIQRIEQDKRYMASQLAHLEYLKNMRRSIDADIDAQVLALRMAGGTWAAIGAALGISKQAAQQRPFTSI